MAMVAPPAAAPAAAPRKGQAKTFRIGCILPFSGATKAPVGKAVKAAIQMAIDDLAPKKLPGIKVELTCLDTQCNDVRALRAAVALVRKSGVDALIGDVCSSATLAAAGVANRWHVPMVSPAATATVLSQQGDYFFRTVPNDVYQGLFAADRVARAGIKSVIVANSEGTSGRSLASAFIAAFTKNVLPKGGLALQVAVPYGRNVSAVMAEIERVRPDGVFIAANNVPWPADLIKAIRTSKPPISSTKVFAGAAVMDPAVAAAAGPRNAVGVRGSDVAFGSPAFVSDFGRRAKLPYSSAAAHAYDAAWALIDAFAAAAEPKGGAQVAAALAKVAFQGKSGPVAFDASGDLVVTLSSYVVAEFTPDGRVRAEGAAR